MCALCSYIIPVPVIKHFIAGVEESGKYAGFCSLGLSCQPTENFQLRNYFGMRNDMTGVLVSKINPLSNAYKILNKDDIILAFDGVPIANDGTGTLLICMDNIKLGKLSLFVLATHVLLCCLKS